MGKFKDLQVGDKVWFDGNWSKQRDKERKALLEKLITNLRDQPLETLRAIDGVIEKAKEGADNE